MPPAWTSPRLQEYADRTGGFSGFGGGEPITNVELLELDCDVLIPAAIDNVITEENARNIKSQLILEAANHPITPEADRINPRGRPHPERRRNHRAPGHIGQRQRGGRVLLRVDPEPAGVSLGRELSKRRTQENHASGLLRSSEPEHGAKDHTPPSLFRDRRAKSGTSR